MTALLLLELNQFLFINMFYLIVLQVQINTMNLYGVSLCNIQEQ